MPDWISEGVLGECGCCGAQICPDCPGCKYVLVLIFPRGGLTDDWTITVTRPTAEGTVTIATIADSACVGGNGSVLHIVGGCGTVCETQIATDLSGAGGCDTDCTGVDPIEFNGCDSGLNITVEDEFGPVTGLAGSYWFYKLCDTLTPAQCCQVQSGSMETDDDGYACVALLDENNECCTGTGSNLICGQCCAECVFPCIDVPFYYEQYELIIAGVIDNPDYTGSDGCDCSQFNGTHIFTIVDPAVYTDCLSSSGYDCVYVSNTTASSLIPTNCDGGVEGECVRTDIFDECFTGDTPLFIGHCSPISGGGVVVTSTIGPCDDGIGLALYSNNTASSGLYSCAPMTQNEGTGTIIWSTIYNPCVNPASPNCYNSPCIFDLDDYSITWRPLGSPKKCAPMASAPSMHSASRPNALKASKEPSVLPACADPEERLLAGVAAALGLNPVKTWYACRTGEHLGHCRCGGSSGSPVNPKYNPSKSE